MLRHNTYGLLVLIIQILNVLFKYKFIRFRTITLGFLFWCSKMLAPLELFPSPSRTIKIQEQLFFLLPTTTNDSVQINHCQSKHNINPRTQGTQGVIACEIIYLGFVELESRLVCYNCYISSDIGCSMQTKTYLACNCDIMNANLELKQIKNQTGLTLIMDL